MGIVRGSKIIKDPYGEAENSNIDYVKQRKLRINRVLESGRYSAHQNYRRAVL
jgi:hypothetical protein